MIQIRPLVLWFRKSRQGSTTWWRNAPRWKRPLWTSHRSRYSHGGESELLLINAVF